MSRKMDLVGSDLIGKNLYINQCFNSVQGEGINIGIPSIFVRLTGCNCVCKFCDTKYTWMFDENIKLPGSQVITNSVQFLSFKRQCLSYHLDNMVITGGEPLLYCNNNLFAQLFNITKNVEIETNGILLNQLLPILDKFEQQKMLINISLKLDKECYLNGIDFSNLALTCKQFIEEVKHFNTIDYCFKFVYKHTTDILIEDMINQINIPQTKILFMPLTPHQLRFNDLDSINEMKKLSQEVIKYCLKHNYRFSTRLQLYLFDDVKENIDI